MKKICAIIIFTFISINMSFGQNDIYSLSASKLSSILRMAADEDGNLYLQGMFSGTLSLGNQTFNSPQGAYFLCKMDPSYRVIWAIQSKFWAMDMKVHDNKLFILGQYNSDFSFKGVERTYKSDNSFFACLDGDGNLQWFTDAQSNGAIYGAQFDIDGDGNSYVLCSFKDVVKLEDKQLNLGGDKNAFLAKYNPQGKLLWLKHMTGGNSYITGIWAYTVCYDSKNKQVLVGGNFAGGCTFDAIKIKTRKLTFGPKEVLDGNETFIAKYSLDGVCTSVKSYATEADLNQLLTDAEGNMYLGGHFKGDVAATKTTNLIGISIFGVTQKIKTTLDADMGPSEEGYIAKFNAQDQFQWIARCEGKSTERITDFVMDKSGNIYAIGFAHVEVGFFGKTKKIPVQAIHGTGEELYKGDIFIVKINPSGDPEWFKMAGGNGNDDAKDICLTNKGLKVCGFMSGTVDFDNKSFTFNGKYYNGAIISVSLP
jgi:hypothetical protein